MKTLNENLISRQANSIKSIVKVDNEGHVFVTYKNLKTGNMINDLNDNIPYLISTVDFLIGNVRQGIERYNSYGCNYRLWSY